MHARSSCFALVFCLFVCITSARAQESNPDSTVPNPSRWKWLKGTYWFVPKTNLPAMQFRPLQNTVTPVVDQTVYEITDYKDGYFWGRTVVQMSGQDKQYLALFGSVTPEGAVLLTFIPFDSGVRGLITQGEGKMRHRFGQWTMENQMISGPNAALQTSHWAYMLQVKPGDEQWKSLPGVKVSVPVFFRDCPEAPEYKP